MLRELAVGVSLVRVLELDCNQLRQLLLKNTNDLLVNQLENLRGWRGCRFNVDLLADFRMVCANGFGRLRI